MSNSHNITRKVFQTALDELLTKKVHCNLKKNVVTKFSNFRFLKLINKKLKLF